MGDWTAAVNWYLYPNLRVMLNYIHSQLRDRDFDGGANDDVDGNAHAVQMRFQVDF